MPQGSIRVLTSEELAMRKVAEKTAAFYAAQDEVAEIEQVLEQKEHQQEAQYTEHKLDTELLIEEVDAQLSELFGTNVASDDGVAMNPAERFNAWALTHETASASEKFEAFKEFVLAEGADLGVSLEEQHAIDVAKMESALMDVGIDQQASLQEQLVQYGQVAEHYNQLGVAAKGVSFNPMNLLDAIIEKQNLAEAVLTGKQQQLVADVDAGIAEHPAASATFLAQQLKGTAPVLEAATAAAG